MPLEPTTDDEIGMAWWNAISERERAQWLAIASSARPVDAWRAYNRHQRELLPDRAARAD